MVKPNPIIVFCLQCIRCYVYVTSYTVCSGKVRKYETIHSYSEVEKNSICQRVWRDHESEYFNLRMDFHFQVDACASDAYQIRRLIQFRDYNGIRMLRLRVR